MMTQTAIARLLFPQCTKNLPQTRQAHIASEQSAVWSRLNVVTLVSFSSIPQKDVSTSLIPNLDLSVWPLGFLSQAKDVHVRLTGFSKLPVRAHPQSIRPPEIDT